MSDLRDWTREDLVTHVQVLQDDKGGLIAELERLAETNGELATHIRDLQEEIAERTADQSELLDSRGRWRRLAYELMSVLVEDRDE